MLGMGSGFSYGIRIATLGLITVIAATSITATSAEARKRTRAKSAHRAKVVPYTPPYAAIVIDANSGKVLHESNADAPRHPASITKVMTLYLLFEQLEGGKLSLRSELPVSAKAAAQAPSKLGLKPGQTIAVDDAIRALVTKSANDVAVVVAEALGETEGNFARQMTGKARALGMSHTVYLNASGLPNPGQITTARDQALLGRAIQDRFPKYYRYFSTLSFTYKGHAMRNHNKLLGSMDGIDGIKTGYVNASGFNLLASLRRNNRHLVAVVMGGRSGKSRDARMRELLNGNVMMASVKRTAPVIAEAPQTAPTRVAAASAAPEPAAPAAIPAVEPAAVAVAAQSDQPETTAATPAAGNASGEIEPIRVKTVKVKASMLPTVAIAGSRAAKSEAADAHAAAPSAPDAGKPAQEPKVAAKAVAFAKVMAAETPGTTPAVARGAPGSDWMIQVGALESQQEAAERIDRARVKAAKFLKKAKSFTEPIIKADMKLWRARFAGISKNDAEAACKTLKSAKIVCIALRN